MSGNADAAAFQAFKGFASAVIENERVLTAVKTSLEDALKKGIGLSEWRKGVDKIFDSAGVSRINSYQLNTIYTTETSLAYGAGQFAKLQEVADDYPYWEYSAVLDSKTRPSHRALHGKVFKAGDSQYYPPLGYNCRCTAIPISRREAERRGITAPSPVTPEDKSALKNAEFAGNKNLSYQSWVNTKLKDLSKQGQQAIKRAAKSLEKTIAENQKYV